MAIETKYGNPDIEGIPADEPIFILRAQDSAALTTLEDYRHNASTYGATHNFLLEVGDAIDRFSEWKVNNDTKTPD